MEVLLNLGKNLWKVCKIVDFSDERLLGIEFKCENKMVLFVNLYLPFDSADNQDECIGFLFLLESITLDCPSHYVFYIGEFNANIACVTRFGRLLSEMCTAHNLKIPDSLLCDS